MSSQYIVTFIKDTNMMTDSVDCFAEIDKSRNGIPFLTIRTHKLHTDPINQTLFYKFITNNFANISYNDNNNLCYLKYKEYTNEITSTIMFDSSSSSSYAEFKKNLDAMMNTKNETEYYPNDRVMYTGELLHKKDDAGTVIGRLANGTGVYYYDLPGHKIKYSGEFENGLFDGAGTFYSDDGKFSITANNISSGVPTQIGKLSLNFCNTNRDIVFAFNDIWDHFKYTTKEDKKTFVLSNDFTKIIVRIVCEKNYDSEYLDNLIFEDKPDVIKINELRKQITTLTADNLVLRKEIVSLKDMFRMLVKFTLVISIVSSLSILRNNF